MRRNKGIFLAIGGVVVAGVGAVIALQYNAGVKTESTRGAIGMLPIPRNSICVVAVQNRTDRKTIPMERLDEDMVSQFGANGFDAKPVSFGAAAEVDQQARAAGCKQVIYSEVVELKQGLKGTSATAELNYRLFSLDEQRITRTGTVKAKGTKETETAMVSKFITDNNASSRNALEQAAAKLAKEISKPAPAAAKE